MKWLFRFTLLFFCPILSFAQPYFGINFAYLLIPKEPSSVHATQLMFNYDPQRFKWRKFNIYFDAGVGHFWVTNTSYHHSLNIYSLAPVIRYTFKHYGILHPYLELSIGIAYLSQTRLDDRNLGIHFAFQDRFGVGLFLGKKDQWLVGFSAIHYSNGSLSIHNSGITGALALNIGYRFCA